MSRENAEDPAARGGCGPVRPSRRGPWRAAVLIGIHVLMIAHFAQWKVTGTTLTPLEPSEAMQTLELGLCNAGFILFVLAILATLVLGRFFCGWACHVVAYQDLCAWLLKKAGIRPRPVRSRLLVYVPLVTALYMFVWPTLERVFAGDPAPDFEMHLTTDEFWATFPGPVVGTLTLLVDGFLLVYLLGGKAFCTYGCPYGGFFGVVDRVAKGRIRVTDACEGCGHCTAVCTSNVRVHQEVALHRMVMDPGCMKCLDCVSTCPKDALYFGFGGPTALGAGKAAPGKPRRHYDFTWPEEIAAVLLFLGGLFSFRGLNATIPFLFAIGLGVVTAIAGLTLWRLARRPALKLQHLDLKRGGALTRAGLVVGLTSLLFLSWTAHSAVVNWNDHRGTRDLEAARAARGPERIALIAAARQSLERVRDWSLIRTDPSLWVKLGAIAASDPGRQDDAVAAYRRALELQPESQGARFGLGEVLFARARAAAARGESAPAAATVREALELRPRHPRAWTFLADLQMTAGDAAGAFASLERHLEIVPGDSGVRRALVRAYLEHGRAADATRHRTLLEAAGR